MSDDDRPKRSLSSEEVTPPARKFPRPPTRSRDERQTHTPPVGVAIQLGRGIPHVPGVEIARSTDWDETTHPGEEPLETIKRRMKRASENSRVAIAENKVTTARVDDLRKAVDGGFAAVDTTLKLLVPLVQAQATGAIEHMTVTKTTEVTIGAAEKLDAIDVRKFGREWKLKVLAMFGGGGVVAIAIAYALGKC